MTTEVRSRTMEELWRIKEEAWREVSHLPLEEAIAERIRRAKETAARLGFPEDTPARKEGEKKGA